MKGVQWPEVLIRLDNILHSWSRRFYLTDHDLDERAIERPFVFSNLPPQGRVLDVGCTGSDLPIIMTSLGYSVVGIDTRPYQIENPPFRFVRGDIRETEFRSEAFDIITAVSAIEHIGLSGRYGSEEDPDGDRRSMKELRRILKGDGTVVLTVPYGLGAVFKPWHRVYGSEELGRLVEGFRTETAAFFVPDENSVFKKVSQPIASQYEPYAKMGRGRQLTYSYGLACLALRKESPISE